jgi:hypothetical protein
MTKAGLLYQRRFETLYWAQYKTLKMCLKDDRQDQSCSYAGRKVDRCFRYALSDHIAIQAQAQERSAPMGPKGGTFIKSM